LAILFISILINKFGDLAQSEERVVSNDEAPGSKPGFSINIFFIFFFFILQ